MESKLLRMTDGTLCLLTWAHLPSLVFMHLPFSVGHTHPSVPFISCFLWLECPSLPTMLYELLCILENPTQASPPLWILWNLPSALTQSKKPPQPSRQMHSTLEVTYSSNYDAILYCNVCLCFPSSICLLDFVSPVLMRVLGFTYGTQWTFMYITIKEWINHLYFGWHS